MKQHTQNLYNNYVLPTYNRYPVSFIRGEGVYLYSDEGRRYLDFGSGIGVNSLGTAHPAWLDAVTKQAALLGHISNLYYSEPAACLAEKLCGISGMQGVFFANSGAEANEGAIKTARKYSFDKYGKGRSTIATLVQSFHGRTVTTLSATGQDVFHDYFFPFTEGFVHVPASDIAALEALGSDICAVMLEPIQGEGGVLPLTHEYLCKVQALCMDRDWLLIADEVQTGIGRTGNWFAFQGAGISPDIVSFAKGIAGGLPFGGFLTGARTREVLKPGQHATTFGGNPVCAAAALAVLGVLEPLLPNIREMGLLLRNEILAAKLPCIKDVRGQGLMLGIAMQGDVPPQAWVRALLDAGLVTLTAGQDAIRLLPPLIIKEEEIREGASILINTMREGIPS